MFGFKKKKKSNVDYNDPHPNKCATCGEVIYRGEKWRSSKKKFYHQRCDSDF
jgi:predicted RNA-binding Zn-ribbon protein involved in translation (DUF1610 family)